MTAKAKIADVPTPSEVRLALIPRLRTDRRSLDPAIKSGNYLNNLLGLAEAKTRGATDCVFLNQQGKLTEASTSNFYLVSGGAIHTPPLTAGLLEGTTRRLLLEFCTQTWQRPRHRQTSSGRGGE